MKKDIMYGLSSRCSGDKKYSDGEEYVNSNTTKTNQDTSSVPIILSKSYTSIGQERMCRQTLPMRQFIPIRADHDHLIPDMFEESGTSYVVPDDKTCDYSQTRPMFSSQDEGSFCILPSFSNESLLDCYEDYSDNSIEQGLVSRRTTRRPILLQPRPRRSNNRIDIFMRNHDKAIENEDGWFFDSPTDVSDEEGWILASPADVTIDLIRTRSNNRVEEPKQEGQSCRHVPTPIAERNDLVHEQTNIAINESIFQTPNSSQ